MKFSVFAILLAPFILGARSHPKNSDILPKDYNYKRQILQPIPGYIPVYIKADGETVIRSEPKKYSLNGNPQKITETKPKNLFKQNHEEISSENQMKKSDEISSETDVKEVKTPLEKPQEKPKQNIDLTMENEMKETVKDSGIKA